MDDVVTASRPAPAVRTFPLRRVRLLPGPFRDAQDADVRYVLALDPDRLLAPYLREAGCRPTAPPYGSWEGDGMGGHVGGHHLSACAQLWAATGDARLHARVEHVLDVLQRCQDAVGTGYLGGVPGGAALGEELASGHVDADTFSLNGRWVPLYNLHKTFAGLLDAAVHAQSERALAMAVAWADWWMSVSRRLDDATFEEVLRTEFGGMCEAFATLAGLTGRPDHLAEAERFAHRALLDPLAEGRDVLDGLHANTQIAKAVGWARLAALTGDERYAAAVRTFWRLVAERRTTPIGGTSVREHFVAPDDVDALVTDPQGPESCNTVNMVELATLLHERTGDPALLDLVERASLNHLLSAQHPVRGGFVYFTPLRPAHYRVLSQPHTSMWCCVGTGMEAHARHGAHVFTHRGEDDLAVELPVAARLDLPERGLAARLEADPFTSDEVALHLAVAAPLELTLRVRRPSWAHGWTVHVDGERVEPTDEGGYLVVRRRWSGEHTLAVAWATGLAADAVPGGTGWAALRWGPVVLASRDGDERLDGLLAGEERMAHVAAGPTRPLARTPVVPADDPVSAAVLVARAPLRVDLAVRRPGQDEPSTVRLEPFALVHDERYTTLWPVGADVERRRAELAALDRAQDAGDVVDEVAAGEQQPESDHAFAGESTRAGRRDGRHVRSATGWFAYTLGDPAGTARVLRLTFAHPDPGDPRAHEVLLDGTPLAHPSGRRDVGHAEEVDHALPPGPAGRTLTVAVHARDGLPTGDLLRVRLLAGDA